MLDTSFSNAPSRILKHGDNRPSFRNVIEKGTNKDTDK
jgi:hypothetical protein